MVELVQISQAGVFRWKMLSVQCCNVLQECDDFFKTISGKRAVRLVSWSPASPPSQAFWHRSHLCNVQPRFQAANFPAFQAEGMVCLMLQKWPGTFAPCLFPKLSGFMDIYHSSLCFPGFISIQTPVLSSNQLCKAKRNKHSEMEVSPKLISFRGKQEETLWM